MGQCCVKPEPMLIDVSLSSMKAEMIPSFDTEIIKQLQEKLQAAGACTEVLPGLEEFELVALEAKFELRFPPELRQFLAVGVPIGKISPNGKPCAFKAGDPFGWHNWRFLLDSKVRRGGQFDTVTTQKNWNATPRPCDSSSSFSARSQKVAEPLARYPLVPVWSHRMMPTVPHRPGLPVLSMLDNDLDVRTHEQSTPDAPACSSWSLGHNCQVLARLFEPRPLCSLGRTASCMARRFGIGWTRSLATEA